MPAKNVLFYITGHGFGHATRTLEVMKHVHRLRPEWAIHIQSDVPEWLFRVNLPFPYKLISRPCDVGVLQKSSYDVAIKKTLRALRQFIQGWPERIPSEVNYIQTHGIELVVGDIPPLAFAVARKAGIPSVAISNFSWDWIYEPYVRRYPEFIEELALVKKAYSHSTLLLRLPFSGDLNTFPQQKRVPLIARKAVLPPESVREKIGVTGNVKLVLIALRSEDLTNVALENIEQKEEIRYVFFVPVPPRKHFLSIQPDFLPFQNLVAASDLVISKPGYGIVSECIANRTPILFLPRRNFREYPVLRRELLRTRMGRSFPRSDFLLGNWYPHVAEALNSSNNHSDWAVNGAEKAAQFIVSM